MVAGPDATTQTVDALMNSLPRPTAIVCDNDDRAAVVLKTLAGREIGVPDEVSVIGFDNTPLCERTSPRLTTVDSKAVERGERALQYVLDLLCGKAVPEPQVFPELIVRDSTATTPAGGR